jgi:asparagine synthase (glutamine-hydrolysing)
MALPGELKLRNGTTKYFLRQAMAHLLPPDILNRPKRGFGPPFDSWLKAGLLDVTRRMLLDKRGQSRGLYDAKAVQSLLASDLSEHRAAQQIWMLLILETWFRIYIDNRATSEPAGGLDDLL